MGNQILMKVIYNRKQLPHYLDNMLESDTFGLFVKFTENRRTLDLLFDDVEEVSF